MAWADLNRLTWTEHTRLVNALGTEEWLAERIQHERKLREWSQAELSRRLTAAGHPMHQSAISKIEPPDPAQRSGRPRGESPAGRRAVTVAEAIAFAKVFEVPLVELLLPVGAIGRANAMAALGNGPDALKAIDDAQTRYENFVLTVAREAAKDAEFRATLQSSLERADESGDACAFQFAKDCVERATQIAATRHKRKGSKR